MSLDDQEAITRSVQSSRTAAPVSQDDPASSFMRAALCTRAIVRLAASSRQANQVMLALFNIRRAVAACSTAQVTHAAWLHVGITVTAAPSPGMVLHVPKLSIERLHRLIDRLDICLLRIGGNHVEHALSRQHLRPTRCRAAQPGVNAHVTGPLWARQRAQHNAVKELPLFVKERTAASWLPICLPTLGTPPTAPPSRDRSVPFPQPWRRQLHWAAAAPLTAAASYRSTGTRTPMRRVWRGCGRRWRLPLMAPQHSPRRQRTSRGTRRSASRHAGAPSGTPSRRTQRRPWRHCSCCRRAQRCSGASCTPRAPSAATQARWRSA